LFALMVTLAREGYMVRSVVIAIGMIAAFAAGMLVSHSSSLQAQGTGHIYEFRIYTAAEGKMDAVLKRFQDPEAKLFEKYGMPAVLYSTAFEPADRQNQFVYVLRHDNRDAARASWEKFRNDPDFRAAAQASDQGGKAVVKVESFFVNPTSFSPMQ
jgi:hypothetical protein